MDHEHRGLHGLGAEPVQGFLAELMQPVMIGSEAVTQCEPSARWPGWKQETMKPGSWNDANLIKPPKDGSSYLLIARIDVEGERPWPVVGHWDPVEEWRLSAGDTGLKLVDIRYWMAIPEIPTPE